MKELVLNYYSKFCCVADKCKHTCCAGWEMRIDVDSLHKYKNDVTEFAPVLKNGIDFKRSKFKADKKGRCAFLNKNGLCEIIINKGEDSLCQVCTDHPRFRSYFADRVETGLGFCCEQVAKIVLSTQEKIQPILIADDGKNTPLDFNQTNVLEFRQKVLGVLQDRSLLIDDRIKNILRLCNAEFNDKNFKKTLRRFLSLERLNKSWTQRLKSIKLSYTKATKQDLSLYAEQFLANSFYRHLSDAEDTMWVRARTIACLFSWWVVKSVVEQEVKQEQDLFEVIVDVVREYSAEVEYSQKNLDKLFSLCYKFIKI